MVPTEQEEVLWVLDLIGQQQADGLQRLLAPVHVVAQEQVVALWREAAILEQPQKVIVLAMDVTWDPGNQVSTRGSLNVNPGSGLGPREEGLGRGGGQGCFQEATGTWAGGSPQILRGASSSRRMGWLRKISRDLRHRPRISFSVSCTFFPGLEPCTGGGKRRQDAGSSGEKRVNDIGGPTGASGWGRLGLPARLAQGQLLLLSLLGPPTALKALARGLLCAEATQNLQAQDPFLGD